MRVTYTLWGRDRGERAWRCIGLGDTVHVQNTSGREWPLVMLTVRIGEP